MLLKWQKSASIKARLKWLALFSGLVLSLTVTGFFFVDYRVNKHIDGMVGTRFEEWLANSRNRSDFALLHARLSVFRTNFYGNPGLVEAEGQALADLLDRLARQVDDPAQTHLLSGLKNGFSVYLDRIGWINSAIALRIWQEEDISELLMYFSERLLNSSDALGAGPGGDVSREDLARLRTLRQRFERLSKSLAGDHHPELLLLPAADTWGLITEVRELGRIAGQIGRDMPAAAMIRRDVVTRFDYLAHLLHQYQLSMQRLGELDQRLDRLNDQIMEAMLVLDLRNAAFVKGVRNEIGAALFSVFVAIFAVFFLLFGAVLWAHRHLFRNHVLRPMSQVGERLKAFEEGDHHRPMQLDREDEWCRIETVFNQMLHSLEKSVSSLRDSERRYREIFANATEGIFRASLEGRFLTLNPAAAAMLGHDSEGEALDYYVDLATQFYCDPNDRRRILEQLRKHGRNINFEVRVKRKDGHAFWASMNNHLVHDEQGNFLYIEGTLQDITQRKTAEAELKHLKDYLQTIIDSMPSVLIGVDDQLRVCLWNRKAEEDCGPAVAQALGQPVQDCLHLVDFAACSATLAGVMTTRQPERLHKLEGSVVADHGRKRYFDMLIYPLGTQAAAGVVIHLDDVSERTYLEESLIHKEKMTSVAGLAAGFAHELNNPLAVILQSAQVMERRLSADLPKNQETARTLGMTMEQIGAYWREKKCDTMLSSIADAGNRAAKIVENIQTFSRNSRSDVIRHRLDDLLDRTLDLAAADYDLRRQLQFQRIRIVRHYQQTPEVVCDAGQIQQTLLILLKNAARALVDKESDPQIRLRIDQHGDQVRLEVRDNGVGMSAEVCRRVFDPFYSTQEVGQGVGLSLSIAYFIITRNHNGRMVVSSEPGAGSCFAIYLPAAG